MAGDWIKVRDDLHEDPAVGRMADTLGLDKYAIVGRLVRIWSWADRQSRDGHAAVAPLYLDDLVSTPGMANAMRAAKWLEVDSEGHIVFPNFERHNGKSAKKRALATRRKQDQRARDAVTLPSRSRPQGRVTREEKSISNKHLPVANSTARLRTPRSTEPPSEKTQPREAPRGDAAPIDPEIRRAILNGAGESARPRVPFREPWERTREGVVAEGRRRGVEPVEGEAPSVYAQRVREAPAPEEARA